ncbi:YeeE/YedE family protein [Sulfitobacter sp. D35]|uniref:YeeE/YedE family protein n=1 Tax=Sulfitobacter sp. D35 TaxID=3083252 RepID=UPI00296FAF8D|nr:YeeE/YedE family protein [Sulfitobacter sp. D35]MDW4497938.1 YeeE/YedE family protein [Sulfitobacter sp. D35]
MLDMVSEPVLVAGVGAFGGILLGLAARLGRFCTLGAIEDHFFGGSSRRALMWVLAIGIAVFGTFTLSALGYLRLEDTLYLARGWNPLACCLGGLAFGYGMALSGNCGYGALARLGGGDLRAFVIVLVMGISAYAVLGGPFAALRMALFPVDPAPAHAPGFAHAVAGVSGLSVEIAGLAIGLAFVAAALASGPLRREPGSILWAVAVGLAIASGWAGTFWVAENGFAATRIVSHSFSAPIGESLIYFMTAYGNSVGFGTGSVAGVIVGAFAGSVIKGHFRWEACEDPRELGRQMLGAALMGAGAVIAVGCSVGQGLSGFSVLAFSAPLTLAAIVLGAVIGLRQLLVGFARAA